MRPHPDVFVFLRENEKTFHRRHIRRIHGDGKSTRREAKRPFLYRRCDQDVSAKKVRRRTDCNDFLRTRFCAFF